MDENQNLNVNNMVKLIKTKSGVYTTVPEIMKGRSDRGNAMDKTIAKGKSDKIKKDMEEKA
jgi:hypothetical protein